MLRVFVAAIVLAMLFGAHAFAAQGPMGGDPVRSLTQGELDEWVPGLVAHVEAQSARKFTTRPVAKVVPRQALAEVYRARTLARRQRLLPNSGEAENALEAERVARSRVSKVFADYEREDRIIYVVDDGASRMQELASLTGAERDSVLTLLIVYELVEALLHQEKIESEDDVKPEEFERSLAVSAATCGARLFLTRRIAGELGDAGAMERFDRSKWKFELPSQSAAKPLQELVFVKGEAFIKHHFDAGGIEGVWAALRDIPKTEREIRNPGWKPAAGDPRMPDFKQAADRVRGLFKAPWDVMQADLPESALGGFLVGLEPADQEAIVKSGIGGRAVVANQENPRQFVTCAIVHVGDAGQVKKYIASLEPRTRLKTTRMMSIGATVSDVSVEELAEVAGDHRVQLHFSAELPGDAVQETTMVVARGRTIVEVSVISPKVDRQFMLDVVRAALNEPGAPSPEPAAAPRP